MNRRIVRILLAAMALGAAGCGKKEADPELVKLEASSQEQLEALKKHNSLLNRKLIGINERLNTLQEANTRLTSEVAFFTAAPDTMKAQIINEVNRRFMGLYNTQSAFVDTVSVAFKSRMDGVDRRLAAGVDGLNRRVEEHQAFVRFVTTQQDSLNRELAYRIDKRPWVESILGKWEDMEHERQSDQ